MKIGKIVSGILVVTFFAAGCLDILSVSQPTLVPINATFNVTVSFQTNQDSAADGSVRFGAVKLPVELTVNSAVYDGSTALVQSAAYESQLTADFPPGPGYYWWVGTSSDNDSVGFYDCVISMTSGNTVGNFLIDYRAGFNNGSMVYKDAELDVPLEITLTSDADVDGMSDDWENAYSCMMANTVDNLDDYDSDNLNNGDEFSAGTNPCDPDTDSDGMPDGWEITNSFDPLADDSSSDADSDNLTNLQEYNEGTNPQNPDTDEDGLQDDWEVSNVCMDANFSDAELDYDSDNLSNLSEYIIGSNPCSQDTDNDDMPDHWEIFASLDPLTNDASGDPDSDNLTNLQEYNAGTNPQNPDTDNDGMPDDWEESYACVNSLLADDSEDPDGDFYTNLQEFSLSMDPCTFTEIDTDGDGMSDAWEKSLFLHDGEYC